MPAITDVIQSVYTITKAIYDQVQLAKANKAQCQTLLTRVNIVVDSVRNLEKVEKIEHYRSGLEFLEKCLQNCSLFITAHANTASWFKQVLKAGTASERFKELNEELQKSIQLLNLGLQAQQIINRDQDKRDQDYDHHFILQKQDEIVNLNQQANAGIQKLQLQQTEQTKILSAQLESIKAQITAVLAANSTKNKSKIDPSLAIPYYELAFDKKLGQGVSGTVYLGQWQGHPVAIKSLNLESKQEETEELTREVQIMSRLRHNNIVQLNGVCLEPNRSCIVMEYMQQGSLETALAESKFSLSAEKKKKLILDIANGLSYLHSRKPQIFHRDLKSANILIDAHGTAKLADFGLSKVITQSINSVEKQSQGIAWLAPECFSRNSTYTAKSDVYSFGMLVWEIMTRKKPYLQFQGITRDNNIVKHVLSGHREAITQAIPEFYAELILSCWEDKTDRRPDMDTIVKQLNEYAVEAKVVNEPISGETLYNTGIKYEEEKNLPSALNAYKQAAQQGYYKAYTNLGFFSLTGVPNLVAVNKTAARDNFLIAANNNHERAMINLARMYEKGDGITPNISEALKWYKKLAAMGNNSFSEKIRKLEQALLIDQSTGYINNFASMK